MVRRCIVKNCKNIDSEILCHRFPKVRENFLKWIENLKISSEEYTHDEIAKKFVVCTIHFDKNDYKNKLSNKLNTTAVPKMSGHIPRVSPQIVSPADDIIQCIEEEFPITSPSNAHLSNSQDILNISMDDSILLYDVDVSDSIKLGKQKFSEDIEILNHKTETYESDVEVIDFDHVMSSYSNVSETVSLISSGDNDDDDNTSPVYFDYITKKYAENACQVDTDELSRNGNCDEDEEYQNMERKQLIELIKKQKKKIFEMDIKLKEFQKAHSKLMHSMEAFQLLIENSCEDIDNSTSDKEQPMNDRQFLDVETKK